MKARIDPLVSLGVSASLLFAASTARADPRTHDGLFLRLGLNLGYANVTETAELAGQTVYDDLSIGGFTPGLDIMLGGTVAPGLVVGGAIIDGVTPNPSVELGGVEAEADGTLIMVGVAGFVNYYFDPNDGFNVQALLGFGTVDFEADNGGGGGNSPSGLLLGAGAGYDFWVADEWSIGPFGRFVYGAFGDSEGNAEVSDPYIYGSVGAAFTLH